MKSLIVGQAGREAFLGALMARDSSLHVVMEHANPTLVEAATISGGAWRIGGTCDPAAVAAFAREHSIEIAMVTADDPLEAGVVDALRQIGVATVGPTRAGAEIEWNKSYARAMLGDVAPEANPKAINATTMAEVDLALSSFRGAPIVVKPVGLTGGKGVKVMGPHLRDYEEARSYAEEILAGRVRGGSVLIEEKLVGLEFTIQAITDGSAIVFPPATYDYPYRCDGDTGPGTGGMGSFSDSDGRLPFLDREEYEAACVVIERVIRRLAEEGRAFSGILNAGFIATGTGVKVVEFNARFGDPECLNIMSLFDGSWIETMQAICEHRLTPEHVRLRPDTATVAIYLVSPEYAFGGGTPTDFTVEQSAIEAHGCRMLFHSSVAAGDGVYRTLGTSRAVGIATAGPSLEEARGRVIEAIAAGIGGPLEWRRDIASAEYVEHHLRAARTQRDIAAISG